MSNSTNLQLPYLQASQAQKHVTVNDGVRLLDALVMCAVEDKDLATPPGSPADGARYIPASGATGAWSTWDLNIAYYVDGAWKKIVPREGFTAYVRDEDTLYTFNGSTWSAFSGGGSTTLTGDVTGSGSGTIATAIANNAISNAKLRDSTALSVIGNSTNATADPADIAAGADGHVLRRSGTALGFGTIATAGIGDDQVTYAKIQNVSATDRLLGRDTAGAGDAEELTVGGGLEFTGSGGVQRSALTGDVTASAGNNATTIANNAVSNAKLRDSAALSVIGNSTNASADPADIAAANDGEVLRRSGTSLGFGTIATAGIANDAITYAKIQNVSATDRLLGRDTAGAGDTEELTVGGGLEFTGSGGIQRSALTGDITASAGSNATTLAANQKLADIAFIIDGGGSTITTGVKGFLEIPFDCTINRATLLADQSGSIVVNIWKDTYANFPPTVADKITASAPPTIASATKAQDSTLTGWTTTITAGDVLAFNVDSVTTIQRVTLSLKVTKT